MARGQEIYSRGMLGAARRVPAANRNTIGRANAPAPWCPMPPGRSSVRCRNISLLPWLSDTAARLCVLGFMPLATASVSLWFGVR